MFQIYVSVSDFCSLLHALPSVCLVFPFRVSERNFKFITSKTEILGSLATGMLGFLPAGPHPCPWCRPFAILLAHAAMSGKDIHDFLTFRFLICKFRRRKAFWSPFLFSTCRICVFQGECQSWSSVKPSRAPRARTDLPLLSSSRGLFFLSFIWKTFDLLLIFRPRFCLYNKTGN